MSTKSKARYIKLADVNDRYTRILEGPPSNYALKSGLVQLKEGESIGEHSTEQKEELLVIISGKGVAYIEGVKPIEFTAGNAVYIPPKTKHDIKNTGDSVLKYVFTVTSASQS